MLSRNGLADLATASLFFTVGVVAAHAQPMKQHPLPTKAEMAMPLVRKDPTWVQTCSESLSLEKCREINRDTNRWSERRRLTRSMRRSAEESYFDNPSLTNFRHLRNTIESEYDAKFR